MDILGIGPLELLLVMVIALLVVPPNQLGKVGRSVGRFLNRLFRSDSWRLFRQASSELQHLPSRLAREAQLEELREIEKEMAMPDLSIGGSGEKVGRRDFGAIPRPVTVPPPAATPAETATAGRDAAALGGSDAPGQPAAGAPPAPPAEGSS